MCYYHYNMLTIGKTRVTYHKYPFRDPPPKMGDIFGLIYKYLKVVPRPTAIYLYQDQVDWIEKQNGKYSSSAVDLYSLLRERGLTIIAIPRPTKTEYQ